MTGKTHMAIGTATAVYILPQFGMNLDMELIGGAILGSLILDLDHPQGKLNQKLLLIKSKWFKTLFYGGLGIFLLTSGWVESSNFLKLLSGFLMMIGVSSHRSFTHSILGLGIIGVLSYLMARQYGLRSFSIGIITGATLHLLADMLTHHGVALLYPFKNTRIKFPITIQTDGFVELGVLILSSGLVVKHMVTYI